jgi:7-cyano-7-deazaguanine reductase
MAVQYDQLPLGKQTTYTDQYDASLLVPVPRSQTRDFWSAENALPFIGNDLWTAYEVSWLNTKGKPQIACLLMTYSEKSRNIVESKSLKLYLNSFNQTRLNNTEELINTITADLVAIVGCDVNVELPEKSHHQALAVSEWTDRCIDDLDIAIEQYNVDPSLLRVSDTDKHQDILVSHLLRSNCPVTGQPDWASLRIIYQGNKICEASLLRYVCSYRLHQGFHEQCIERMFCDIWLQCKPERLSVEGRFTRRGGLDINPFRASHSDMLPSYCRQIRQ